MLDRSDLCALERHDGHCLAVECNKFDFVSAPAAMDVYHGAHVARRQLFGRDIGDKDYTIMLSYRSHALSCSG